MGKKYHIIVGLHVPFDDLDQDDKECWPELDGGLHGEVLGVSYDFHAENEEDALDQFHAEYPISCLDNFKIGVYLARNN